MSAPGVAWLNRGTLHLVASEDYPWLHALTAPTLLTASARRLAQEGVTPDAAERGVTAIERAGGGGSVGPWAAARANRAGGGAHGGPGARAPAAGGLVAGCGGTWADGGWPARVCAVPRHERNDGLLELQSRQATGAERATLPRPRLLGAFDPLLLGWRSRAEFLDENEPIVTVNGLFRPFALVHARAAATWSLAGGEVTLKLFASLASSDERALRKDAEDVVRFLWP